MAELKKRTDNNITEIRSINNSKSLNKIFNKRKITILEPFNLSINKPKILQEPIHISNTIKALPLPKNLKNNSLEKIENERNKRIKSLKENIIERTEKDRRSLTLETDKRPNNIDKIRNLVENNIKKNLKFNQKYAITMKNFEKFKADVKYNEAAILKEEYMIDKKNKEEEEELNKYLIEKKDRKEFDKWVNDMKIRDEIENIEKIDRRKIELMLNREISSNYYNLKKNRNNKDYMELKEIEKINNKQKKEEKEEDLKNKKNIVFKIKNEEENALMKKKKIIEEIKKEKKNALMKKIKLIQENKNIYKKRKKEYNELYLLYSEEDKIIKEKRDNMVNQIRTLEKIPKKRETGFDPTETPGYGILNEMSLAELRERLTLQKKMTIDELNSKREENKLKLQQRADEIYNKALIVQENRNKLKNMKELERKYKKEKEDNLNEKLKIEREKNKIKCKKEMEERKKK